MKATLTIQMDNAAFGEYPEQELARILRRLAGDVYSEQNRDHFPLFDRNGNTVGSLTIEED